MNTVLHLSYRYSQTGLEKNHDLVWFY